MFTKYFSCLAILAAFVLPSALFAQTEAAELQELTTIANINVGEVSILNHDEEHGVITLTFTLANLGDAVQPGVTYSATLLDTRNATINEQQLGGPVTIDAHSEYAPTVQYKLPAIIIDGEYTIWITADTIDGLPLGAMPTEPLLLQANTSGKPYLDQSDCKLVVDSEDVVYRPTAGVDVSPTESLTLLCGGSNLASLKSESTVAELSFYARNAATGRLVAATEISEVSISDGFFNVSFPASYTPEAQAYDVVVTLTDETLRTNEVSAHYVVQGESATIVSLSTDATSYEVGDTAMVVATLAGPADAFVGSRGEGSHLGMVTFETLLTVGNTVCGSGSAQVDLSAGAAEVEVPVSVTAMCVDGPVEVTGRIVGEDGVTLAFTGAVLTPVDSVVDAGDVEAVAQNNYKLVLLVILFMLAAAVGVVVYKNKEKDTSIVETDGDDGPDVMNDSSVVLKSLLFMALVFFMQAPAALAGTGTIIGDDQNMSVSWSFSKTTLAPGERFTVTVGAKILGCVNDAANVDIRVSPWWGGGSSVALTNSELTVPLIPWSEPGCMVTEDYLVKRPLYRSTGAYLEYTPAGSGPYCWIPWFVPSADNGCAQTCSGLGDDQVCEITSCVYNGIDDAHVWAYRSIGITAYSVPGTYTVDVVFNPSGEEFGDAGAVVAKQDIVIACPVGTEWNGTSCAVPAPAGVNPKGIHAAVDNATCTTHGWTCDDDDPSRALTVSFYDGNPASGGAFLGTTAASRDRADLAGQCGGTINHAFFYSLPYSIYDGLPHSIYVVAHNVGGGTDARLASSPRTIQCPDTGGGDPPPLPADVGVCGPADGTTREYPPSSRDLCAVGDYQWTDALASDGSWNWDCRAPGGNASCSARKHVVLDGSTDVTACEVAIGDSFCLGPISYWSNAYYEEVRVINDKYPRGREYDSDRWSRMISIPLYYGDNEVQVGAGGPDTFSPLGAPDFATVICASPGVWDGTYCVDPAVPNLTTDYPELNSGTLVKGETVTFSAGVENTSAITISDDFQGQFYYYRTGYPLIAFGAPTSITTNLLPGESISIASEPFDLINEGHYNIVYCVDEPVPPGIVAESNEDYWDNCARKLFTVLPYPPANIDFTANGETGVVEVLRDSDVDLEWHATNVQVGSCEANWLGPAAVSEDGFDTYEDIANNRNFIITCADLEGNDLSAIAPVRVVYPQGQLTSLGCTIANGDSTCSATLEWQVNNVTDGYIMEDSAALVPDVDDDGSAGITLSPTPIAYELFRSDGIRLDDLTLAASCAGGSAINDIGVCAVVPPPPAIDFYANPQIIRSGDQAEIVARITANYDLECELINATAAPVTISHSADINPVEHTEMSQPLDATQVVTLVCPVPGFEASLPPTTVTTRVEVIPAIEEI